MNIKRFDYTTDKTKRKLMEKMIDNLEEKDKKIERLNSEIEKLQKDKDRLVEERDDLLSSCLYQDEIIKKAIKLLEELISDTKGIINDYNHEDKEETITRFVEDLKTDIKHYEHLEDILRGEDNE
jgi:GH35 family endo-1,4-beta-xylanase